MHQTARENFVKFLHRYYSHIWTSGKVPKFLDIGSMDFNGTLKEDLIKYAATRGVQFEYVGMDVERGRNVDLVYDPKSCKFPVGDQSFDVVVSSSCFEHDPKFWVTIKEMARVLKRGGLMYIQAPKMTIYHAYPIDCWRFYEDSWKALADWCSDELTLAESYVDPRMPDQDSVGIYRKK